MDESLSLCCGYCTDFQSSLSLYIINADCMGEKKEMLVSISCGCACDFTATLYLNTVEFHLRRNNHF